MTCRFLLKIHRIAQETRDKKLSVSGNELQSDISRSQYGAVNPIECIIAELFAERYTIMSAAKRMQGGTKAQIPNQAENTASDSTSRVPVSCNGNPLYFTWYQSSSYIDVFFVRSRYPLDLTTIHMRASHCNMLDLETQRRWQEVINQLPLSFKRLKWLYCSLHKCLAWGNALNPYSLRSTAFAYTCTPTAKPKPPLHLFFT